MKQCIAFCVIYFSTLLVLHSQTDNELLNLHVDYASFNAEDDWSLVEFYYSYSRDPRIYSLDEQTQKYSCMINFDLTLSRDDSVISKSNWTTKDVVAKEELNTSQNITDLRSFLLKEGNYIFSLTLSDSDGFELAAAKLKVVPISFSDSLQLSDVQFALNIERSSDESRFVKNSYSIVPNPAAIYNEKWSNLYYYFEIYNLSELEENKDSTYSFNFSIVSSSGENVYTGDERVKKRLGSSLVEVGQINVAKWSTDSYYFIAKVKDLGSGIVVEQTKKFFKLSEKFAVAGREKTTAQLEYPEFMVMLEDELDYEFELLRYMLSSDEKSIYEDLNLTGKREFLRNYWVRFDERKYFYKTDEPRKEFLSRVKFSNDRFGMGSKEGWRSDQGRIIIKYGMPDDIRQYQGSGASRNYEIWIYNEVEGGCQFVFVNLSGYGEMKLVHSTALREIQNFDWQQRYLK